MLHRVGEYGESVTTYRRALTLEPQSAGLHYNLANSLMDLGTNPKFETASLISREQERVLLRRTHVLRSE